MLQRFLHGLAFGAGFAVSLFVVMALLSAVLSYRLFSTGRIDDPFAPTAEIDVPPDVPSDAGFLGSTAIYSGDFDMRRNTTLASGDGKIVGKVLSNSEPVSGVRLRLALNGNVMSGWSTTDAKGVYTVAVPFGRYRIDGYELDNAAADRVLAGKIGEPRSPLSSPLLDVAEGADGEGLTLRYVDPVVTIGPRGTISSVPVVVSWQPYPGAQRYVLQLYETATAYEYPGPNTVFSWRDRPEVEGTSYDVTAAGATLKPGYYYTIEIEARDAAGRALSTTTRRLEDKNFRFVGAASP